MDTERLREADLEPRCATRHEDTLVANRSEWDRKLAQDDLLEKAARNDRSDPRMIHNFARAGG